MKQTSEINTTGTDANQFILYIPKRSRTASFLFSLIKAGTVPQAVPAFIVRENDEPGACLHESGDRSRTDETHIASFVPLRENTLFFFTLPEKENIAIIDSR